MEWTGFKHLWTGEEWFVRVAVSPRGGIFAAIGHDFLVLIWKCHKKPVILCKFIIGNDIAAGPESFLMRISLMRLISRNNKYLFV